jgi:hypothetical protein
LDLAGVIKVYGIEKYQNTLVIIFQDFGGESLKQLMANLQFQGYQSKPRQKDTVFSCQFKWHVSCI